MTREQAIVCAYLLSQEDEEEKIREEEIEEDTVGFTHDERSRYECDYDRYGRSEAKRRFDDAKRKQQEEYDGRGSGGLSALNFDDDYSWISNIGGGDVGYQGGGISASDFEELMDGFR